MSFLDTLKNLNLFQGGQAQGQPAENPYGLDDAAMRQARMSSLGTMFQNMMVLGQQMTPSQRAQTMAGMDFSGGMQENLYNAAQAQMLGRKAKREQQADERELQTREQINAMIKQLPPGRLKQAATYFFTAGDYAKAGEMVWTRTQRMDPMTGEMIEVDALGAPIGASSTPNIMQGDIAPASGSAPAPAAGGSPAPLPAPADTAPVNQLTTNWRRLLQDPLLTPQEARLVSSQGSQDKALEKHQEILKNRQAQANTEATNNRQLVKDRSDMANAVLDDRRTEMETPQRIVDFAQGIEDTLSSGNPTAMRALATQVLFSKVLDPGSAFMTGEADLQQTAASWGQRFTAWLQNASEGAPIPGDLVLEMREISRQLGRRALAMLETIDKRATTRANASGLDEALLGGKFSLRWNRFADPGVSETGTGRREPPAAVLNDIETYGG